MSLAPRGEEIRMQRDEFRLLRDLVNGYAGIYFGDEALNVLERRLRERVTALGLKSFGEYYQFLRLSSSSTTEIDDAVELLTTNETYFFREDYQLRAFRDELLPMLAEREGASRRRLSVWSAGCSTGEEVYTIAISARRVGAVRRLGRAGLRQRLSRRCVALARRGIYGPPRSARRRPSVKRALLHRASPRASHGRRAHPVRCAISGT